MLVVGAATFGIIIGYLAWRATRPRDGQERISFRELTTFIGVVGGAAIVALFPAGTEMFAGYCMGLSIGFFFTPIWANLSQAFARLNAQNEAAWQAEAQMRQKAEKEEQANFRGQVNEMNLKWDEIQKFLRAKLRHNTSTSGNSIWLRQMEELNYSPQVKYLILQKFARQYVEEGVYLTSSGGLEYTVLYAPLEFCKPKLKETAQRESLNSAPRGVAPTPISTQPVAEFMTTYVLGDDLYDDSFSIDTPDGTFLGECGMAISETIGGANQRG